MIGFFCLNFVIYFFITWFPTYLMQARGFSLAQLGTLGPAARPGLDSLRLARRLHLRRTVPPRLEPDRGAQDLPGRRHADVLGHHLFGLRAQRLCRARLFRGGLWQPRLYRRQHLVLAGDVAPTPAHVASIGGIQNFAANIAGIVTTTFTGLMLTITSGSFRRAADRGGRLLPSGRRCLSVRHRGRRPVASPPAKPYSLTP